MTTGSSNEKRLAEEGKSILEIDDLTTAFSNGNSSGLVAVDHVGLKLKRGRTFGLVGESGAGKTVLALSTLGLLQGSGATLSGAVVWDGRRFDVPSPQLAELRGRKIAMIFQNAQAALNPVFTIGKQLASVIRLHRGLGKHEALNEAKLLLNRVQLPEVAERLNSYPHELSGGMCQRVMIAMALACQPSLLIADEPTSSLDVTTQAGILSLLEGINREYGMSIWLITHDLGVVAQLCDTVAVMYCGRIVETGPVESVYTAPKHPYTRLLLKSVPVPTPRSHQSRETREAPVQTPVTAPPTEGCRFRPRCKEAFGRCVKEDPRIEHFDNLSGHYAACWLHDEQGLIDSGEGP